MTKAVIDIGTNSIKLIAAERDGDGVRVLHDEVVITRLGDVLADTGAISDGGMERTLGELARLVARARELGADELRVLGTACLRRASNAAQFVGSARELCGVDTEVISIEDEARLCYAAAVRAASARRTQKICTFDIGGGSSEVAIGSSCEPEFCASLPLGALVLHDEFFSQSSGPIERSAIDAAIDRVKKTFDGSAHDLAGAGEECQVVATGGTVTTAAKVAIAGESVNGFLMSSEEVERQLGLYSAMPVADRTKIPFLPKKRADVILAGCCVIAGIMSRLRTRSIIVSGQGLRWSAVCEMLDI